MTNLNQLILEVEAREKAATPGEWRSGSYLGGCGEIYRVLPNGDRVNHIADVFVKDPTREFIAHSREDIPKLLAAVKALMKENEVLRDAIEKTINEEWIRVSLRTEAGNGFQIIIPAALNSEQAYHILSIDKLGLWKGVTVIRADKGPNHVKDGLSLALAQAAKIRGEM